MRTVGALRSPLPCGAPSAQSLFLPARSPSIGRPACRQSRCQTVSRLIMKGIDVGSRLYLLFALVVVVS